MPHVQLGAFDLSAILRPDSWFGALLYLVGIMTIAKLLSGALCVAVHAAMTRKGHADLTTISFLQQIGSVLIWIIALILYAHLIPVLRSLGTALLAGASIASVVIGLAAQSTLGNLVAGIAITIYRPFRLGDRLQVAAPTGTEVGEVELISLGYTSLLTSDGRRVVLPNSLVASQVTLNLTHKGAGPLAVSIKIHRDADLTRAREVALQTVRKVFPDGGAGSCELTAIDADLALFILTVDLPAQVTESEARSKLLSALTREFAQAGLDEGTTRRTSFS